MKWITIALLTLACLPLGSDAHACSIMPPEPEEIQTRMAQGIARELGIRPSEVSAHEVGQPQLIFPRGLGADCSGLEHAVHTAIFDVRESRDAGRRFCSHWGLVVLHGVGLNGRVEVRARSSYCGVP